MNRYQFFYKSVGTFVSVTPRIVNWGLHGEGSGEAVLNEAEVLDWNRLIHWMLTKPAMAARIEAFSKPDAFPHHDITRFRVPNAPVPIRVRTELLQILKEYPRVQLHQQLQEFYGNNPPVPVLGLRENCEGCRWNPQDCTIDLSLVVRLSEPDLLPKASVNPNDVGEGAVTIEKNVRALANVVQVKSGHGAVIGGLIGAKDTEEVSKVPVLGDVPIVGFAFRSKVTNRQKTELLIFVEATVLDPDPGAARAKSHEDFVYGQPFVYGEFLDNPLEYGMYRAGFGTYLPPHSHQERVFWERLGRKVRRASTELDDAFE